MIFQKSKFEHVLVLGLQNRQMWEIARKHIRAYRLSSCGPWAGKGIICVGDGLRRTDSLPEVIIKSEAERFQRELNGDEICDEVSTDDEDWTDSISEPTTLYQLADRRYKQVRSWEPETSLSDRLIGAIVVPGE